MKTRLTFLLLCCLLPFFVAAQSLSVYLLPEHVETVAANGRMRITEAFIMDCHLGQPGNARLAQMGLSGEDPADAARPLGRLRLQAETVLTPTSQFLRLPLSYEIGSMDFSLSLPYYFRRTMEYTHGDVSTRGFGDVQLRAAYHLQGDRVRNSIIGSAKLPTGDASKMEDGFLVPLGTGTTDFMAANVLIYRGETLSFYNNLSYRISGDDTRLVEVFYPEFNDFEMIEYQITHGNTLAFSSVLTYHLPFGIGLNGGVSVIYNTEGSMDKHHSYGWDKPSTGMLGIDLAQDFLYVDVSAGVSVSLFDVDIMLNLMPPVFTRRNVSNTEAARKTMFLARICRQLF